MGTVRLVLTWTLVLLLVVAGRPTRAGVFVGAFFIVAGEALRVWAAGHLVKNERLVTSGPYAYVRNPLYLGRLFIFSGLCVMSGLPHGLSFWVLAAGCAVFFGYYLKRKERVEPARLLALHGTIYARYQQAVPALIPRMHAWSESGRERWSLARAAENREHWMALGATAALAWLLARAA